MNFKEIKELIKIVHETDIGELTLENDEGWKLAIKKASSPVAAPPPPVRPATNGRAREAEAVSKGETPPEESEQNGHVTIVAPMVGTFYRASAPDAKPYVEVGDTVDVGQPLCIIEAMKLMNEIESEVKGQVVRVLVENAQPVEYGQPLFLVEPH